jgi:predicted DNA-binding transcriptional regulator AlpA
MTPGNRAEMQAIDVKALGKMLLMSVVSSALIDAKSLAKMLSISAASLWRLHAAARVPAPVKLGGRTLWRLREDIEPWIRAGCPDRPTWEGIQSAAQKGRN